MKYVDEYREPARCESLLRMIEAAVTRPWTLMEVCGGQTHSLLRNGIDTLLPDEIRLIHGPGCPVCVTPLEQIDRALAIAARPDLILVSFGDMLRVPGSSRSLLQLKAEGADVRLVYSPLEAVEIARRNPTREVVFFAVGFETTAPATALAVRQARKSGLSNFSMLVSHVLVAPAMEAVLASPSNRVRGFLAAGHVAAVMGCEDYERIAERFHVPIVVTGFEPVDLLEGILLLVRQLEAGTHAVQNQYARTVRLEGNRIAREIIEQVYEPRDLAWRGIGLIPMSGLRLREEYAAFDAERRFSLEAIRSEEPPNCRAGEILQGLLSPIDCEEFGKSCTPDHPLGAPMVSSEGACAAYWRYARERTDG